MTKTTNNSITDWSTSYPALITDANDVYGCEYAGYQLGRIFQGFLNFDIPDAVQYNSVNFVNTF
jgi:hypothetical protein